MDLLETEISRIYPSNFCALLFFSGNAQCRKQSEKRNEEKSFSLKFICSGNLDQKTHSHAWFSREKVLCNRQLLWKYIRILRISGSKRRNFFFEFKSFCDKWLASNKLTYHTVFSFSSSLLNLCYLLPYANFLHFILSIYSSCFNFFFLFLSALWRKKIRVFLEG